MFKSVSLPNEVWAKVVRRLSAEVGADNESRRWAEMIREQTSGEVKISLGRGTVTLKVPKGGDLRGKALPEGLI